MTWANTIILSWFGEGNLDFFFISLSQDTYEMPKEKKTFPTKQICHKILHGKYNLP